MGKQKTGKQVVDTGTTHRKSCFSPISNEDTTVLVLGTMPGDTSLELGEYYGHSRNRFWKVISTITNSDLPLTYTEKKSMLLRSKIGVWDIVHKANRVGSLDSAIQDEEPNDLDDFIAKHRNLKVIGFNGIKSEALFNKYFSRKKDITYISLPSTSPANATIDLEGLCKKWLQLIIG